MPQNTGAGGCLFASSEIFIFKQCHVFLKTSFISLARACVRVCVLPELWFTFPDGWMGIQSPFFKVVHKMYLLFFISCLSQGVICFHSEK